MTAQQRIEDTEEYRRTQQVFQAASEAEDQLFTTIRSQVESGELVIGSEEHKALLSDLEMTTRTRIRAEDHLLRMVGM